MSFAIISLIQGAKSSGRPFLVLFDSGSTSTWINCKALPSGINGKQVPKLTGNTMAGTFTSSTEVTMNEICFPEFHRTRKLVTAPARVFHAECRYDIIIGRDILQQLGMILDFDDNRIVWDNAIVTMREYPVVQKQHNDLLVEPTVTEALMLELCEEELLDNDEAQPSDHDALFPDDPLFDEDLYFDPDMPENDDNGQKSKTIRDALYEKASIDNIARSCSHLSLDQQNELAEVLRKHD